MNDRARIALEIYTNYKEENAEIRACKDWAISEIYLLLCDHPFDDPEELIAGFSFTMLYYSKSKASRARKVNTFTIAYDTAQEILAMLECPKEE